MAKTKEEILERKPIFGIPSIPNENFYRKKNVLSAMQEYADQCTSQLREELEGAKKDNEAFKREFTEAMDDVARLGGENEKLQKEIDVVKTYAARLCVLHSQEQEGLSTVMPEQWFNAVNKLTGILGERFWDQFHKSENNL